MSKGKSVFTYSDSSTGADRITVYFEDKPIEVPSGITVAAALLGHEDNHFCQSAADNDERAPYCLMGVCFECLVEIDGHKNRQACLEPVKEGMRVNRQYVLVSEKK